jgi:hypothetical protein
LSDAIISKATGENLAVIATPVINKENDDMTGILLGTINFNNYDQILQPLNLQNNTRLVMIDKNGVKIGDSNEMKIPSQKNPLRQKNSFQILVQSNLHWKVNQEVF